MVEKYPSFNKTHMDGQTKNLLEIVISDGIRTGSGPEKVRVVLETGNPGNSDQSPVPS